MSQMMHVVARGKVSWAANPLVALARPTIAEIVRDASGRDFRDIPNGFDIVLQTMLSMCYFPTSYLWRGSASVISTAAAQAVSDLTDGTFMKFAASLDGGRVRPNREALEPIVEKHLELHQGRLDASTGVFQVSSVHYNADLQWLRIAMPMITTKGREWVTHQDGTHVAVVREKVTRTPIVLKPVEPSTSRAYAEKLHYLHSIRHDEFVSYGAFLPDARFPFAWASYSPIGAHVEREIASRVEPDVGRVVEVTRAWNAPWAPKNSMSVLLSFAHRALVAGCAGQTTERARRPVGAITAINSNLGFTGMAFRGVDFGVVGLKPTTHSFVVDDGIPIYVLPHDAVSRGFVVTELVPNSLPLRHTHILMTDFRGRRSRRPDVPVVIY